MHVSSATMCAGNLDPVVNYSVTTFNRYRRINVKKHAATVFSMHKELEESEH